MSLFYNNLQRFWLEVGKEYRPYSTPTQYLTWRKRSKGCRQYIKRI